MKPIGFVAAILEEGVNANGVPYTLFIDPLGNEWRYYGRVDKSLIENNKVFVLVKNYQKHGRVGTMLEAEFRRVLPRRKQRHRKKYRSPFKSCLNIKPIKR